MIKIGNKQIGGNQPVFIIGEIGLNHNGSVDIAKNLINLAKDAGFDAVKFQKRNLNLIYQKAVLDDPNKSEQSFQYLIPLLKKLEFTKEQYDEIIDYCNQKNIIFFCTPWDNQSVDFLEDLNVEIYKIGSPDLNNLPLLDYISSKNKPMIVSVGMFTSDEIDVTYKFLKEKNAQFIFLHCNSTYPAPFENINLNFIKVLKQKYDIPIGYSGHERGIAVCIAAVSIGAKVIEKHITLDKKMEGPDHRASLEPDEFKGMVKGIREAEKSLGQKKKFVSRGEILTKELLSKSLVAAQDIKNGEKINKLMIAVKGPGKGLSPQKYFELIGKTVQRNIKKDDLLLDSDLLEQFPFSETKNFNFKRIWGFKTRLAELDETNTFNPKISEVHFSDKDLNIPFNNKYYDHQLCVHVPEYWYSQIINLCDLDREKRKTSIRVVNRTFDKTRGIASYFKGTPKVVLHIGGMDMKQVSDKNELKKLFDLTIESFKKLNTQDIEVLPENMPPNPWYFSGQWYQNLFASAEDMVDLVKVLNLNLTYDISHAKLYCNLTGESLLEYTKKIAPFIKHIHIADASGIDGEGLQIGEGEVDFDLILKFLEEYEWSWVPEIWKGHQENYKGFVIALNKLLKYSNL